MRTSENIDKIAPDLVAALGEMEGAAKSSNNPHFRSKYANLEAVVDASRGVLAKHNLAVLQGAGHVSEGKLHVTTRILHASGQWVESETSMPLVKSDPQATLAALTYCRRGALMAILGMPAVDDDGETAMGRGEKAQKAETAKPPQQTLAERYEAFAARLKAANSTPALERVWSLGAGLLADLDKADEALAADLREIHETRLTALNAREAA